MAGIVGHEQHSTEVVERRQPAGTLLPMIVSFADPLEIVELSDGAGAGRHSSFIAGFMPGWATTRFIGLQRSVQVYLTPLGAMTILGIPGREIAARVVNLDDIAPTLTGSLPDRLHHAATWEARIRIIENVLLRQLDHTTQPAPAVEWLWRSIRASKGQAHIADLISRTGWSRRHASITFREQVGLPPKAAAGVVRFEHAAADLGRIPTHSVAAKHGYSDQSHLARDIARRTGETPRAFQLARRPTAYTALGEGP